MDKVTLSQIRTYLPSQGWSLINAPDEFLEVWRAEHVSGSELLLPTELAVDKELLLAEVLSKFAEVLGRTIPVLVQDIREFSDNVVSIRVVHPDVKDGSIPLEDGIALNKNAKDLISAAANAALERRAFYIGRPPALVSSLIQSARLGQTTQGSYVIHVFCRDPALNEESTDFAQVTTETLQSALSGLKDALGSYEGSGNTLAFETAFNRGASANLCDALTNLSGKDRARTVEITLTPKAAGRLTPADRAVVSFSPSDQPSLRAAADYFRQTYSLPNETITGAIERLERPMDQDSGVVRIATTLSSGAQRSVRLPLALEQYQEAIHAHENKMLVQVTGTVVVTPKTANVLEPRGFTVVGNYELFNDSGDQSK